MLSVVIQSVVLRRIGGRGHFRSSDKDVGRTIRSAIDENPMLYANCTTRSFINVKNYQFKTHCKGDISHAFETAKITVVDPVGCKTSYAPLQNELLY